jgi:hypothetical protein
MCGERSPKTTYAMLGAVQASETLLTRPLVALNAPLAAMHAANQSDDGMFPPDGLVVSTRQASTTNQLEPLMPLNNRRRVRQAMPAMGGRHFFATGSAWRKRSVDLALSAPARDYPISMLGFWHLDRRIEKFYANDRLKEIFGFDPQEKIKLEDLECATDPAERDDRIQWKPIHGGSYILSPVDDFSASFRIIKRTTGQLRLIHSQIISHPCEVHDGWCDAYSGIIEDVTPQSSQP